MIDTIDTIECSGFVRYLPYKTDFLKVVRCEDLCQYRVGVMVLPYVKKCVESI